MVRLFGRAFLAVTLLSAAPLLWQTEARAGPTPRSAAQPQAAPIEKDITIYGAKIHYAEAGSGPTLILLHGLGGSWQNWMFNIDPLAAEFHVFAPDHLGFGKSEEPLIIYIIGTHTDFLHEYCE